MTMRLICPEDYGWVPAIERPAEKGDVVDVDDETAAALQLQGWKHAPKSAPTKES